MKGGKIEVVGLDIPKGGNSRVLFEIWDGRDWGDKGVNVEEDLSLLIMRMLI